MYIQTFVIDLLHTHIVRVMLVICKTLSYDNYLVVCTYLKKILTRVLRPGIACLELIVI